MSKSLKQQWIDAYEKTMQEYINDNHDYIQNHVVSVK